MEPASAEKLLKAFQILDSEGKGTLSKEYTSKLMSEEGEPFTQVSKLLLFTFFKFQPNVESDQNQRRWNASVCCS